LNKSDSFFLRNQNTPPEWLRKWSAKFTDSNDKPAPELPARNINVASSWFCPCIGSSQTSKPRWRKNEPTELFDSKETEPSAPVKPGTIFQVEFRLSKVLPEFNVPILTRKFTWRTKRDELLTEMKFRKPSKSATGGHACVLQACVKSGGQAVPLCCGCTVIERLCEPPPHILEHAPKGDNTHAIGQGCVLQA